MRLCDTKDDPLKIWKAINRALESSWASKSITSLNVGGKVINRDGEVTEALNQTKC